jgi:hypothetical protein
MAATTIERRVERLEESAGGGGCSRCGWGGRGPGDDGGEQTYEVVFMEEGDPDPGPSEWCPECGRQTQVTIEFEDGF